MIDTKSEVESARLAFGHIAGLSDADLLAHRVSQLRRQTERLREVERLNASQAKRIAHLEASA